VVECENSDCLISLKQLLNQRCQANHVIVKNLQYNFDIETLIIN